MPLPRRNLAVLVALAVFLFSGMQPTTGAGAETPEEERERVRQQQGEVDSQLDVLQASEAEVAAELDRLAAQVAGAEADLGNAQAAVETAEAAVARLDRQLAELDAEIDTLQGQFNEAAVASYINGGTSEPLGGLADHEPNEAAVRQQLLDITRGDVADLADALSGTRAQREQARADAEQARSDAESARDASLERLADLQSSQIEQQAVAADVEARIDQALYESAALEDRDAALAAEIRERQRELAERLPPPPPEPLPEPSPKPDDPAPPSPAPDTPPDPTTPEPPIPPPVFPDPPGGIVNAGGIQVSASIAPQVEGLMAKASADGVPLGGSGYRNPQEQIDLRIQNCGSSNYAIYQMPPDQCSPETALPGRSKHEVGLAIDFNWGGQVIDTRGHPGFQWLAANAPGFGLVNLPSEEWHWSSDGT